MEAPIITEEAFREIISTTYLALHYTYYACLPATGLTGHNPSANFHQFPVHSYLSQKSAAFGNTVTSRYYQLLVVYVLFRLLPVNDETACVVIIFLIRNGVQQSMLFGKYIGVYFAIHLSKTRGKYDLRDFGSV